MAYDADLDLVEVAPGADPPVCKIMDFGKFQYEQAKKSARRASSKRPSRSKKSGCAPRRPTTTDLSRCVTPGGGWKTA